MDYGLTWRCSALKCGGKVKLEYVLQNDPMFGTKLNIVSVKNDERVIQCLFRMLCM